MLKDDLFSEFPTGADIFSLLTIIFIPVCKAFNRVGLQTQHIKMKFVYSSVFSSCSSDMGSI
ncbi:hypothetical protein LEP1GSC162_1405 [Leptospira santarosai str. CBC1531]|nr:hypothetical protein LEP1GSC162_1405 [Leptospira santarosai str. CBC1531]